MSFRPPHLVARDDAIILEVATMLAADGTPVAMAELVECLNRAGRYTAGQARCAMGRLERAGSWPEGVGRGRRPRAVGALDRPPADPAGAAPLPPGSARGPRDSSRPPARGSASIPEFIGPFAADMARLRQLRRG